LLHNGSGSLSDTLPQLQALHNLGINVFAFDYRGFGKSLNVHPRKPALTRMRTRRGATSPTHVIYRHPALSSMEWDWARR